VTGDALADGVARRLAADAAALDAAALWARSGGMALTGDATGPPLRTPAPIAALLEAAGELLAGLPDASALVGERAAILGFTRRGRVSCGGGARLLRACDGWIAVALPRPVDVDGVPAWLGIAPPSGDPWPAVAAAIATQPAADVSARARLLEIPCSLVGERAPTSAPWCVTKGPAATPAHAPLVVDLSALWAGPLCAQLLGLLGGRVIKVEDPARPDGTRRGPRVFLDVLNGGKQSVALDLRSPDGRRALDQLLDAADVVVSSARPRAFDSLGIDVTAALTRTPTVWVAITAHGWSGDGRDRVGFGDDAAVAGGLVIPGPADGDPRFVADAVADPLTGVLAAVMAQEALARGGSWFVDAPLAGAAAYATALTAADDAPSAVTVEPPRARTPSRRARQLGADTIAVLDELSGGI
jgi:CoA-transferase family III